MIILFFQIIGALAVYQWLAGSNDEQDQPRDRATQASSGNMGWLLAVGAFVSICWFLTK